MASNSDAQNRVERLQVETTVGQYFFQDLYNRDVYFEDFDDKSSNYFKLDYDLSFNLTGGRNLLEIRGTSSTMLLNSEILVEVVDSNGQLMKSQVYGLDDDLDTKVISIDVASNTPPGDTIVTIIGVASQAPNGAPIPPVWQGIPNFRWTRIFTCKPNSSNKSPVLYNESSRPVIKIEEIKKPFFELTHNQALSGSTPAYHWGGNSTSSYILSSYSSSAHTKNTTAKLSYKKSGDKYFVTAKSPEGPSGFVDFGGFTEDMVGGIIIVRFPQEPRPASYLGYTSEHDPNTNPIFAPEEEGDGLLEDISYLGPYINNPTQSFVTGAYVTMVEEVISPFEIRASSPHTTIQGQTSGQYQNFEHFEFSSSNFELMWAQTPISYSANPTGSGGEFLNTSYAKVTFNNLEPLTGDVTRIKCYMKNEQAPFDWVLASDNAVDAQELLYREDFQKHRAPIGNFTQFGVAFNGTASLNTYWTASGVGTTTPSLGLYQQQTSMENPPIQDCIVIGIPEEAYELDTTAFWLFEPKAGINASFYQDQWYELSFKAVSQRTIIPTWTSVYDAAIEEPKITMYMSGSAFTDGGDGYGKFIGLIEDTAVKKKIVDYDYDNNQREIGKKFVFRADGTQTGAPKFKIDSGIWSLWDISIKPWDRKGFTPGTWDVIFPTIKCNVGLYDSLDFKFEFYNDYGDIANYSAVIPNVPWENELTATFTNIVTNTITATGPATFSGGISASGPNYFGPNTTTFGGPVTMSAGFSSSGGPVNLTGPVTISGGISSSGPILMGGPITMSGPGLLGQSCTDLWMISGSVHLPCLPEASQSKLVNWDPATGQLKLTSSFGLNSGGGGADQDLWDSFAVAGQTTLTANSTTDQMTFVAAGGVTITTATDQITFTVVDWAASSAGTVHATNYTNTMGSGFTVSATTDTNATTITQAEDLLFTAGAGISCETTNASTGEVTITNTSPGADNLGNHQATQVLKMHANDITSSKDSGMKWYSSGTSQMKKIYVDNSGNDIYLINQGASDTSQIRLNDGSGGLTFYTDETVTSTPTERMQIHNDGQWDYNSLTAGSQSRILTYDTSTGEIKHTSSFALGGNMAGAGGGGGSTLTVKEEGSALATAATSLDFIGNTITAAGTSAAKTVTVKSTICFNGSARVKMGETTNATRWHMYDEYYGHDKPNRGYDTLHSTHAAFTLKDDDIQGGYVVPVNCTLKGFRGNMRNATTSPVDSISFGLWYTLETDVPDDCDATFPLTLACTDTLVNGSGTVCSFQISSVSASISLTAGSHVFPMVRRTTNNSSANGGWFVYTNYVIIMEE